MPVTCLHGACFIKKQFNKTHVARFLLTADESTTVPALSTAVSRKTTLSSSSFTAAVSQKNKVVGFFVFFFHLMTIVSLLVITVLSGEDEG